MIRESEKDPKKIGAMFSSIAPYYDFLNEFLSLRQASKWRRKLILEADLPEKGFLLDLCTGSGDLALGFIKERPEFRGYVFGIDFSAPMIDLARARVAKLGAPYPRRVEFLMGDALDLQFTDDKFDSVSVGFGVRNYTDIREGLREIHRVLKVGCQVNIIDFFRDEISSMPVKWGVDSLVPFVGNIISRSDAYSYLRNSANDFLNCEEFEKLLTDVGFTDIKIERMLFGIAHIFRFRKSE